MISSSIRLKVLPDKVEAFERLVAQLVRDIYANEPGAKVYSGPYDAHTDDDGNWSIYDWEDHRLVSSSHTWGALRAQHI